MKFWVVYVDGERYYASCRYADANEMYRTLSSNLGNDRVTMTVKKI